MTRFDWLTIGITIVSVLGFANRIISRRPFRRPRTGWAWLLLVGAVVARVGWGPAGFFGNLLIAGRDVGVGLVVGATWLSLERERSRAWLVGGVLLLALWLLVSRGRSSGPPVELLLELGPEDSIADVAAVLERHDAAYEKAFPEVTFAEDEDLAQFYLVRCPSSEAKALMAELKSDAEDVDSIEPNDEASLVPLLEGHELVAAAAAGPVNDPHYKQQWGLAMIHGEEALARLKQLKPKRIALVAIGDTGVDSLHEDLAAVFDKSPGDTDGNGHGTHCAGIAAAVADNGVGIASLNLGGRFVRVLGFPALSPQGSGSAESIAQAIIDAAEAGADVISLSLGGRQPTPPTVEVDAIRFAIKRGAIVVAAAGNDGEDAALHAPANIPGVITVSAVDSNGRKAEFSNTVQSLKRPIAAPGVDIYSLGPGHQYLPMSGTSMAAPMVAGLLAVMRSLRPKLKADAAFEILQRTGIKGHDPATCGRIIDADAAIDAVLR